MSNGRTRGETTMLVSFCNVRDRSKPLLAAVDLRAEPLEVRWIQHAGYPHEETLDVWLVSSCAFC